MDTKDIVAEASVTAAESKQSKPVECLIHVHFAADGSVMEIGERPPGVAAQTWFNYLSNHTLNRYRALSGGRGIFVLPKPEVESLKAACAAGQTA